MPQAPRLTGKFQKMVEDIMGPAPNSREEHHPMSKFDRRNRAALAHDPENEPSIFDQPMNY